MGKFFSGKRSLQWLVLLMLCYGSVASHAQLSSPLAVEGADSSWTATVATKAKPREWSSKTGKFKADAVYLSYADKFVVLKRDDKVILVEATHLSKLDNLYIRSKNRSMAAKVVAVEDGDTITIKDHFGESAKVRLEGIDSPEGTQDHGGDATAALKAKVDGKQVVLEATGTDKYGRALGNVYVDGSWVNRDLVKAGHAWHYEKYSSDPRLEKAQAEAKASKAGLWSKAAPVAPWDFRNPPAKPIGLAIASPNAPRQEADPFSFSSGAESPEAKPAPRRFVPPTPRRAKATPSVEPPARSTATETVYVTKTGSKYHRAGCRYLSKSQIPMSRDEAEGRFSACSVCRP